MQYGEFVHSEHRTTLEPRSWKRGMPGFQHEIGWEKIVRHGRRDAQTAHGFETREEMVRCHHECGTDFRPSESGKRVAD
jgi:hypothetical protein